MVPDTEYWTRTANTRDTVYRFIYAQSPQSIPSGYSAVAEAEAILSAAQQGLSPSSPSARSLWQRIRVASTRAGLLPKLRVFGTIGLGATAFELGWRIGSGINAKFLHLGMPASPLTGSYSSPQITFVASGQYAGLWNSLQMPEDGWAWSTWSANYSNQRSAEYWSTGNASCPSAGPPPSGFTVISTGAGLYCDPWTPISRLLAYLPEQGLAATGAVEPYTSQSYYRWDGAPTPPSQSTVEDSIDDALAAPDNASLTQWLNYQVGSPGETDPTGVGDDRPDIPFPNWREICEDHCYDFDDPYTDPDEYWRDAAETVEHAENEEDGYEMCEGGDGTLYYWNEEKKAVVVVRDGVIITYFRPTPAEGPPPEGYEYDYFLAQCE